MNPSVEVSSINFMLIQFGFICFLTLLEQVYDPRLDRWMIFESWPENLPKEYRFRSTILTSPQPPQPEESTKDSSTEDESESDFENASSEER